MFEQLFASLQKASEGTVFAQREMMRQWLQQWPAMSMAMPMAMPMGSHQLQTDETRALQKRWVESATESLNMQRDMVDSACRAGVEIVQQAAHLSEAKSQDDYLRSFEDLLTKMFDVAKNQSETQLRHLMKMTQAWREPPQMRTSPQPQGPQGSQPRTAPAPQAG